MARADEQLYAAHRDDPQPNPLFDAQGNRRKLDPNDPTQADVQREWRSRYTAEIAKKKSGGAAAKPKTTPPASSNRSTDDPVLPCTIKHWLVIRLGARPNQKARDHEGQVDGQPGYAGEKYAASGACGTKEGMLDGGSSLRFHNIKAGHCTIVFKHFYEDIEAFFKEQLR
ncbi:MAG TPA: hypothetical protein VFZ09_16490 [Archangium sp.]|uniref:hypothetical protein n=1 Tax=Archangium sp. TaxID=1872627 RepID=UPI002E2F996B|nr:hypothetical protein [Archangium sp.]HEX5747844.1 hypothetical protein [Archangium sp.]